MKRMPIILAGILLAAAGCSQRADYVSSREMKTCRDFFNHYLAPESFPFSFVYAGTAFPGQGEGLSALEGDTDKGAFEREWRYDDGLKVTLKGRTYSDYPAVEWTLWIKNEGEERSKPITDLLAFNGIFQVEDTAVVHTIEGDYCSEQSYTPHDYTIAPGVSEEFHPASAMIGGKEYLTGKSSDGPRGFPYWNIQTGKDKGMIMALGWPGNWMAEFSSDSSSELSIRAGQKVFNACLEAGEEVRTPLVCLLFWSGKDVAEAQNLWRRFYLSHVIPYFDGKPEGTVMEVQCPQRDADTVWVKEYLDKGMTPRVCWTDAGWYPTPGGNWFEVGEWVMDPERYPNGNRPFQEWAHENGLECLLWFEPERVWRTDNFIRRNHPEWLLPSIDGNGDILNEGDRECREWLTAHVDSIITANNLDWYREDMNGIGPGFAWKDADTPGREGMVENLYVQGHLAYWDSLKARHPGLHFDSCASGGRRNDLETMRRAVPLLRSDYQYDFVIPSCGGDLLLGNQGHTWALSQWFPFQGTGTSRGDEYGFRCFYITSFGLNIPPGEAQEQAYRECDAIDEMVLFGDYWPLTPYNRDKSKWIAWQFNRTDTLEGCIQAFRREDCHEKELSVKLRGLNPRAHYEIADLGSDTSNLSGPGPYVFTGAELMEKGLPIVLDDAPGSFVATYRQTGTPRWR